MEIKNIEKLIYKVDRQILNKVLSSKNFNSGSKLVLRNLIDRLGYKNYCFPSQTTIGKDLGLSERQVRNHIRFLQQRGVIRITRRLAVNQKKNKHVYSNTYDLSPILFEKLITKTTGNKVPE